MGEMQKRQVRQLIAAALLGGFAMLGKTLVAVTYDLTFQRIEENQRHMEMDLLSFTGNRMVIKGGI